MSTGLAITSFGLIGVFWNYLKLIYIKIQRVFIIKMSIKVDGMILRYLVSNYKLSTFTTKTITRRWDHIKPLNRINGHYCERVPEEPFVIWYKKKCPVLVSINDNACNIISIRGIFDYKKFLLDIENFNRNRDVSKEELQSKLRKRFCINRVHGHSKGINLHSSKTDEAPETTSCYSLELDCVIPLHWTRDELGDEFPIDEDNTFLNTFNKEEIYVFNDLKRWLDNEDWFREREIPWKRGLCLYGKTGTGKTYFAKSLGKYLDLPIYSFDLSQMYNEYLENQWQSQISCNRPCIVLFEDFDNVFHGRKNLRSENISQSPLTFDCFLNVIDGIVGNDGVLTIITTNEIDKLDPALCTVLDDGTKKPRPGRIDLMLEFESLERNAREYIINKILKDLNFDIELLITETDGMTGSEITDFLSKMALSEFSGELDEKYRRYKIS